MRRWWTDIASTRVLCSLPFAAVATRAYVLAAGLCGTLLLGFPENTQLTTPTSSNPILDLPWRWDSKWIVGLARDGYRWDGEPGVLENIAFFPAYPLMLRLVASATGAAESAVQWNWTGVVLSTILLTMALWFLSRLGDLLMGPSTGYRAALLCAVYPWSIYFGLPYTESLFLLACCAATYRFLTGRHVEALLWGVAAGLTRPNGVLLVALLGLLWMRGAYTVLLGERADGWQGRLATGALAVCGPVVGVMLYSLYIHGVTGDPLTWAKAQAAWGRVTMNPFWVFGKFVEELVASPITMARVNPYALANGLTGVAVLALAVPVGRRVGWAFAAFVGLGVLVPVAGGGLASLGRYTAVLFPLFIYLAHVVHENKAVFVSLVCVSLIAQGLISALFFAWRPVY